MARTTDFQRVHRNVAVAALANKLARMAWAVLAKAENDVPAATLLAEEQFLAN